MPVVAAVITGAHQEYEPLIHAFAYDLLPQGSNFSYIRYPGAEAALARANAVMEQSQQFLIRDIIESKARTARRNGARMCVLIGAVACNPDSEEFGACIKLVQREREVISKWGLFREYLLACLTPRQGIIPIP